MTQTESDHDISIFGISVSWLSRIKDNLENALRLFRLQMRILADPDVLRTWDLAQIDPYQKIFKMIHMDYPFGDALRR